MPEIIADNISIINSDELEGTTRIDAEFYKKNYFTVRKKIKNFPKYVKLGHITEVFKKGIFDIKASVYEDQGIPFVRISNLKDCFINTSDIVYIPEDENRKNKKTELNRNDIILSKTAYPAASLIDIPVCNISQDTIGIKLKKNIKELLPHYIVAFLNSKYGLLEMWQWFQGNVQMHLALPDAKELLIPVPDLNYQYEVKRLIEKAIEYKNKSLLYHSQAEALLLEELGMKDIDLSHEPCYEVNSVDTISANRIDAEYYQPKYERVIEAIKNCRFGWCKLDDKITNITDKYDPEKEPEKDFRYIELSNINPSIGVIDGYSELKGNDLPSRARMLIKEGDVIISSVEGSIDKVALVDNTNDSYIASTGFFVFRTKENTLPEYALTLCKSVLIQKQLEKLASGTILTAVPKNLVQNIIIPNTPKEAQTEIANLIRQSHSARRQAKELLEKAKRKVEEMIEKGGEEM